MKQVITYNNKINVLFYFTAAVRPCARNKKGKSEHLYSALHGLQTTLKRSGMDHTVFNLQRTPCQHLPRKRSPDGATTECGGEHLIAFIDPKRIKD